MCAIRYTFIWYVYEWGAQRHIHDISDLIRTLPGAITSTAVVGYIHSIRATTERFIRADCRWRGEEGDVYSMWYEIAGNFFFIRFRKFCFGSGSFSIIWFFRSFTKSTGKLNGVFSIAAHLRKIQQSRQRKGFRRICCSRWVAATREHVLI